MSALQIPSARFLLCTDDILDVTNEKKKSKIKGKNIKLDVKVCTDDADFLSSVDVLK